MNIETISILGAGWLGIPLGKYLKSCGFHVKGSTTTFEKLADLRNSGIQPYYVDLRQNGEIEGEFHDFFYTDLLIISIPPKRKENIAEIYPLIIEACIEQAIKHQVGHILFISSTSVYADIAGKVDENNNIRPDKISGRAIREAENILKKLISIKATILRFGGLIGPDRNPALSLSKKPDEQRKNAPVNLIHIDDCIQIIYQIIRQKKWGYTFNACAPLHPLKSEVYKSAAQKINVSLPPFSQSSADNGKIVDSSYLVRELSYQFIYDDPLNMF